MNAFGGNVPRGVFLAGFSPPYGNGVSAEYRSTMRVSYCFLGGALSRELARYSIGVKRR